MLKRVLEPEVMDTVDEANDYNQMDHSQVNRQFADDFLSAIQDLVRNANGPLRVFDAGTGTALIPIELLQRGFPGTITASDLAEQMLVVAKKNVAAKQLESSIELVLRDCKKLPDADDAYDAAMSNSIIHHIPEPRHVLAELWRIIKPGGVLFVRDLLRPQDLQTLGRLVQTYAGDSNAHQQQMFRESLHAALTIEDVRQFIVPLAIPLEAVRATSDRHWTLIARKPGE
ncbi:class I SAM-dependent methyltransferase [Schlesneria paludicola]|uniref:class I SAM-dependent methyltransferase n=1 Tax=Schlesneria paludicola TaxID=360056 RepID=UPI000299EC7A|nr:class I SAM-dependent methyltransferase [Schlesneria paludicola]